MDVGNSKYKIEIQDYGKAIDINLTKALTVFYKRWFVPTSWDVLDAGGNLGVIAIRNTKGENDNGVSLFPGFEAAYSPDGIGNRGTMIALINASAKGNDFKEDERKFRDLVKNLRIHRGAKG
jgi:hypothetical protein